MNIIAKTSGGYFIEATNDEVVAILTATGLKPENGDKIPAGTKIPAYVYAATIQKVKAFARSYQFEAFEAKLREMSATGSKFIEEVKSIRFEE